MNKTGSIDSTSAKIIAAVLWKVWQDKVSHKAHRMRQRIIDVSRRSGHEMQIGSEQELRIFIETTPARIVKEIAREYGC